MIDTTNVKAHPTASSLNKGGMTSKLHGVCHSKGGPLRLHLQRGNAVASLVLNVLRKDLPPAAAVMGDKRV